VSVDLDWYWYLDSDKAPKRSRDVVYRGISAAEAAFIRRSGVIKSDERYCVRGEGTCFADDFADAVSYVNVGRDNPGRTGVPTFVIEVSKVEEILVDPRDKYPKSSHAIPASAIRRAWRFNPDGSLLEMTGKDFMTSTKGPTLAAARCHCPPSRRPR
jgi:hypothetical protein